MNALVNVEDRTPTGLNAAQAGAEQRQYLTFMLGSEMFSIGILKIKEIIEYAGVPACIRGVINLRGAVVPVMDLCSRLGRPGTPVTKRTCIVIVEVSDGDPSTRVMGIVVDAVSAVLEIPASDIEPPPAFGARIRNDFIEGMGKVNGKFVILLNVNRVLSVAEIGSMMQGVATTPLLPA